MAERYADVLIVTVNPHETTALSKALSLATGQPHAPKTIGKRVYNDFGTLNGASIFHLLTEMGSGGRGGSQRSVDMAIDTINPEVVIAVGIAFGVDEKKQKIGDILISSQLWTYELRRVGTEEGKEIVPRGDKPHASTRLINFFENFNQLKWEGAKAKAGLILTGDKLIDNIDYRNELLKYEGEAIGGEMEGAGVYIACEENKVDWIVIKAICDWADGKKNLRKNQRQAKAAANAAAFVAEALKSFVLIEKSPRSESAKAHPPAISVDALDETRRKSDLKTLTVLFGLMPRPLVSHFLEEANEDRWIYDILTEVEPAEKYVGSAMIHFYDQQLKARVDGFFKYWLQTQEDSAGFFEDPLSTGIARRVHWSREPTDFDKRYPRFHKRVKLAYESFKQLNAYLRDNFPELDLESLDRGGVARYVEWTDEIKREVAEIRKSLLKEKQKDNEGRSASAGETLESDGAT
ncbi:hypothetical protein [Planctomyces sp. SH-PL62]|uniref:5'-methylthioadenosine/S-adenosylhomocysteine nucleosidase family protein n=1 Tax=Planctomyces sp. SH-PL62 TaxID=1636152 RepID=UPI00078BF451|nr:hypothetical protein [Planctomyces sp. SH-PL62]AMV40496.1 5'-methylthioadenosine/S-adenosylhomocysteine nucleosidase [Planctomyces sp. SH-PL62]